jgi:hypothetical protein
MFGTARTAVPAASAVRRDSRVMDGLRDGYCVYGASVACRRPQATTFRTGL